MNPKFIPLLSSHGGLVHDFMVKAKQKTPDQPTYPDAATRELRARLILEEAFETVEALGCEVIATLEIHTSQIVKHEHLSVHDDQWVRNSDEAQLALIMDGCADISVVTVGTLLACGIPDQPVLFEVDYNNLEKFGPGHSFRDDGKLIKPAGHKPPDMTKVLTDLRKM